MTTVTVYDDVSLIPSFWILGFYLLSAQGKIKLRFRHGRRGLISNEDKKWKSILFEVNSAEKSRMAVIDLFDRFDSINPAVLNSVDQYFKFNYNEDYIKANVPGAPGKLFRTGFYFPVRIDSFSSVYSGQLKSLAAGYYAKKRASLKVRLLDARRCIREFRTLMAKHGTLEYYTRELNAENTDLYDFFWNVNYWSPSLNDSYNSIACSNQRVAVMDIVNKIKQSNANLRFAFGFYDNADANRDYPAYVMKPMLPTKEYLRVVARSKMSIVTRGLFDCLSWRMGEHLAMGRFSLMERPLNQSYVPLTEGKNAVFFENDLSDLEEKFIYYLNHDEEREKIAEQAKAYFDRHCRPDVQVRYMINNLVPESIA